MNRREASKIETRRLIIAAARKLLLGKAVEDCTMRGIAKVAGVSPASVVVHFKNKPALLEAALTEDIDRIVDRAIANQPVHGDLADRLVHIWRAMFTFYHANRNLYRALIRGTVFEPEENTPFLTKQTYLFLDFLEQLIESEKIAGRLPPLVEKDTMAKVLFSLYFGALILFFRSPAMGPAEATDLVAAMTRQTLAGMTLPRPAESQNA